MSSSEDEESNAAPEEPARRDYLSRLPSEAWTETDNGMPARTLSDTVQNSSNCASARSRWGSSRFRLERDVDLDVGDPQPGVRIAAHLAGRLALRPGSPSNLLMAKTKLAQRQFAIAAARSRSADGPAPSPRGGGSSAIAFGMFSPKSTRNLYFS